MHGTRLLPYETLATKDVPHRRVTRRGTRLLPYETLATKDVPHRRVTRRGTRLLPYETLATKGASNKRSAALPGLHTRTHTRWGMRRLYQKRLHTQEAGHTERLETQGHPHLGRRLTDVRASPLLNCRQSHCPTEKDSWKHVGWPPHSFITVSQMPGASFNLTHHLSHPSARNPRWLGAAPRPAQAHKRPPSLLSMRSLVHEWTVLSPFAVDSGQAGSQPGPRWGCTPRDTSSTKEQFRHSNASSGTRPARPWCLWKQPSPVPGGRSRWRLRSPRHSTLAQGVAARLPAASR